MSQIISFPAPAVEPQLVTQEHLEQLLQSIDKLKERSEALRDVAETLRSSNGAPFGWRRCHTCERVLLTPRGLAAFVEDSISGYVNPHIEVYRATLRVVLRELKGFCDEACETGAPP